MPPQRTPRPSPLALLLAALFAALCAPSCSPSVGDACVSDAQCGTGRRCDPASYEGYCTVTPCVPGSCPSESVCVQFEDESTYCMATCERDDDCRDGYVCDSQAAASPFCRERV